MHLYRFFDPSADGADSCVVFVSNNRLDAIHAYVEQYHPDFREVHLSKDFKDDNTILMEESFKVLENGRVLFCWAFAIKIS